MPNPVPTSEVARRLRVSDSWVHQMRRRHADFPSPVIETKAQMLWDSSEIAKWRRIRRGKLDAKSKTPARLMSRADKKRLLADLPPDEHGKSYAYNLGCRCDACSAANIVRMRKYHKKNNARRKSRKK